MYNGAFIDPEIKPLVDKLNTIGVRTVQSCAGFGPSFSSAGKFNEDHKITAFPYISFVENNKWTDFIEKKKTLFTTNNLDWPLLTIDPIRRGHEDDLGYSRISLGDELINDFFLIAEEKSLLPKDDVINIKITFIKTLEAYADEYQTLQKMP